jgi:DNA-binding NtrC family response regulator/tetratricopeptide (TPR) repeat protein
MTPLADLIGDSPGIMTVRAQIEHLLQRQSETRRLPPVLFLGETGTGKGLLVRATHQASSRSAGPFVSVNCAAIPETLLEAELFGYEKGAFTDARQAKAGLFQTAHRGTLFLDEIGLLPQGLQAKLLTVLEDRAVRRLGSTRLEPVDVWVIAAASADLRAAVRAGRFREELYHRLAVVTMRLPPLRERGQDILTLAEHFLTRSCADYTLARKTLSEEAKGALLTYRWPGNVRELANLMERVALLTEGPLVTAETLGLAVPPARSPSVAHAEEKSPPGTPAATSLEESIGQVERARILEALRDTRWNISRTADRLGVTRNTLRYRLQKYGLRPPPETAEPAAPAEPGHRPVEPTTPPRASSVRWERRHVALLRADLVATPSVEAVPEASPALDTLVEKVHSFSGQVEEVSPTGLVAAFGLEPLEEAPRRAAHAALAIQKAAAHARRDPVAFPGVRVGLHVGELRVGRVGRAARVDHEAKREAWRQLEAVMEGAEPGSVRVSEAAARFLERRFALAPVAAAPGPAGKVYQLVGLGRTGLGLGERLTPFVGRDRELEQLARCAREARQGGVRAVDVVGEAGLGKSRLVHECRQRLAAEGFLVLQGHCTADGRTTPFLPFIEVLRGACFLSEADAPEAVGEKLARGLARLGLPVEASLPFLQLLLGLEVEGEALRGLEPQVIGLRTREALLEVLRARCGLSPVVLILDDLHWADSASQDLLLRLLEQKAPLPLLLLGTARPPYQPPWAGRPEATTLQLAPLSEASCRQLVRHWLEADPFPDELATRVAEQAEGNPLFAEELARYLVGTQRSGRAETRTSARPDLEPVPLPATLQHLILARVDQLAEGPRAVLEVASVLGRRFPADLLCSTSAIAGELAPHLRDLEAQELLFRDGPEDYRFKHALIQEGLYQSLPAARRESLHQQAAEAIERRHEGRLGEWVDVLAHHWSRTPRADKAVRYLALAGEKSLRVYSLKEADQRFRRAIELIETVPGCADEAVLADLVLKRANIFLYRADFAGLIALADRYRARVDASGDRRALSRLLFWQGYAHHYRARFDVAEPLLKQALALGEAVHDEESIGYASMGLLNLYWAAPGGQAPDGVDRLAERSLAIADRLGDTFLTSHCLHGLYVHRFYRGRYEEARAVASQLLELGRTRSNPRVLLLGLINMSWVNAFDERHEEALENAEEALRVAPVPLAQFLARTAKGVALALAGRGRESLDILQEARREAIAAGVLLALARLELPYGVALARSGRMAAGVRWIEAAIERFRAWGNPTLPAFGHMLLGELYLQVDAGGRPRASVRDLLTSPVTFLRARLLSARMAYAHLTEAVRIAREVDIAAVLARSLCALGLLRAAQGHRDEARACLEEARRVVEPLNSPVLSERIRGALESLGQPRQAA